MLQVALKFVFHYQGGLRLCGFQWHLCLGTKKHLAGFCGLTCKDMVFVLLDAGWGQDLVSPVHHQLQEGSVQEENTRREDPETPETALNLKT